MKIKRESLETIITMHKNICDDKDIRTMSRVVAVFGVDMPSPIIGNTIQDESQSSALRTAVAYATDGVILARRVLGEAYALDSSENGLGDALSTTPLFVLEQHVRAVEGLLRAFKHVLEFNVRFTSPVAGDLATNCVVSVEGQTAQVELGVRSKVEGSFFEYVKREHLDALCEFKGTTTANHFGHETLVIPSNNCPLLGFNAFLLVSLVKALGGSSKDGGCQITLLNDQQLHKDGKSVSTSQIRVTRKDAIRDNGRDVGVLCGMRF